MEFIIFLETGFGFHHEGRKVHKENLYALCAPRVMSKIKRLFPDSYATGSNPPGLNGLQRSTRQIAITPPFSTPYLYTAW
jgi:hypothetical protein